MPKTKSVDPRWQTATAITGTAVDAFSLALTAVPTVIEQPALLMAEPSPSLWEEMNPCVVIQVSTQVYLGQVLTIKGLAIYCPKDFAVFCSYRGCPNWCNGHGVCVNGNCLCSPPWSGIGCAEGCPLYYDSSTNCIQRSNR